jgi:hypothetical protein
MTDEQRGRGRQSRSTPSLNIDTVEFNRLVLERVTEYEEDFEESSITTADRQQLKALAELTLLSELCNRKAAEMVLGEYSPQDQKAVSDASARYSTEARQLAKSLGVDRQSRITDQENELEQYLPILHAQTKEFIYKNAVAIICPHCLKSDSQTELRMGHILYHFTYELKWQWTSICPKCRGEIKINQDNYPSYLFSELEKAGMVKRDTDEEVLDDEDDD